MAVETIEKNRTVDVIIPVYKPDAVFETLLERLGKQNYPIRRIIIMNTEQSFWKEDIYETVPNLEVHHVTKNEFDHGGTRNQGASYSEADIMVFMTDDAIPADRELIGALVKGLSQKGPSGEYVAAAYARQLPNRDCAF